MLLLRRDISQKSKLSLSSSRSFKDSNISISTTSSTEIWNLITLSSKMMKQLKSVSLTSVLLPMLRIMTSFSKDAELLDMLLLRFSQMFLMGLKRTFFLVESSSIFCKLKRLTGRIPFYGKSLKEIVKKNTEANINFTILKKENFSKQSSLKSYQPSQRNAKKKSLWKTYR